MCSTSCSSGWSLPNPQIHTKWSCQSLSSCLLPSWIRPKNDSGLGIEGTSFNPVSWVLYFKDFGRKSWCSVAAEVFVPHVLSALLSLAVDPIFPTVDGNSHSFVKHWSGTRGINTVWCAKKGISVKLCANRWLSWCFFVVSPHFKKKYSLLLNGNVCNLNRFLLCNPIQSKNFKNVI